MHKQAKEYSVLLSIYESLDHPRSLAMWLLLKHEEFQQFFALDFNPLHYNSVEDARLALLSVKLASKFVFDQCTIDRKQAAKLAYDQAEEKCRETNLRFSFDAKHSSYHATFISKVSRKIEKILGEFSIDSVLDESNWGPGVSVLLKGSDATVANKFHNETSITPLCYQVFNKILLNAYPSWGYHLKSSGKYPQFIKGNSIVTVPKNSKTDRTISIEPGFNLWFQKGIGTIIRNRLLGVGIDLRDQSRNRKLSRVASKFNHLATIDFSSASDTISSNVILSVLPEQWTSPMIACRSNFGRLGDSHLEYEKFSSMGNGFTFELESLLFYAISSVFFETDDISVYGDDLIVPAVKQEEFRSICEYFGFSINVSKSYSSGYYRESCGGHFWNGVEITPFLMRENLTSDLAVFKIANRIREYAHHWLSYGCDARLRKCHEYVSSLVNRRIYVPYGFGDCGLISNFDEATPTYCKHGLEGYVFKAYSFIPKTRCRYDFGLLISRVKTSVTRSLHNHEDLPRSGRCKLIKLITPRWYDLGPWA